MSAKYKYAVWFKPSGAVLTEMLRTKKACLDIIKEKYNNETGAFGILRYTQYIGWKAEEIKL